MLSRDLELLATNDDDQLLLLLWKKKNVISLFNYKKSHSPSSTDEKKINIYVFLIFYFSPSFSYVLRVVHSFHIQKWIEIVSVYFDFLLFVLSVPNQVGLRTTTNAGYLVGWTLFLEWNKFPTHHYQSLFHIHRML